MSPSACPTVSDIERIAAVTDPTLRNLQITQCYHELALVLAERTGVGANWCSFATWASKQAGQTIRKEDLARAFETVMGSQADALQAAGELTAAAQRLGVKLNVQAVVELAWKAYDPQAVFEVSSAAVAEGNLKVFDEIARQFARFHAVCLSDVTFQQENFARFCEELRPGDPPDGQRLLRQAFRRYYQALFETEPKARLELLLLGNLETGLHEQTRLQPEINAALAAPVISPQVFARNLLSALVPEGGWRVSLALFILRFINRSTQFEAAADDYVNSARRQAQFIVTETMMSIELPHGNRIRLGDDLTARFPAMLQSISNPDLLDLLAQVDPTPDSVSGSGAKYWGDLPDRLHFIADLFRCYETTEDLFEAPFNPEQTAAVKDGRIPGGRL